MKWSQVLLLILLQILSIGAIDISHMWLLTLSLNLLLSFYFIHFFLTFTLPLTCSSPPLLTPHPSPPLLLTSPLFSSPSYLTPLLLSFLPHPPPLYSSLLQVSLLKLAEITEQGVTFKSPIDGSEMLLTPEQSIQCQNEIGKRVMYTSIVTVEHNGLLKI